MSHDLVLYKFDACPYCFRVQNWLEGREVPLSFRDVRQDPEAQDELLTRTGRTQVPCLFIDGEPLFESRAILDWLQEHYGDGGESDGIRSRAAGFLGRLKRE